MAHEDQRQAVMILDNMRKRKSTTKEQYWALGVAIRDLTITIENE